MSELRATAILFDMDGVLVDSTPVVRRVWRRWSQIHGFDAAQVLRTAHGRRTRDTLAIIAPHLDPDVEFLWLESAELADRKGIKAIPGALVLTSCLPSGRWAVVTSAVRRLANRRLDWAGLPAPARLVPADEINEGKPSPEGYLTGAAALGVAPAECVVFEDAPAGIEAAKAAGMSVVGLTTTHSPEDLVGVDALVPDLTKVSAQRDGSGLLLNINP